MNPLRGAKIGAASAVCFAIVTPATDWLHNQPTAFGSLIGGTVFAFVFFGLIGTFTDKIGFEIGDP